MPVVHLLRCRDCQTKFRLTITDPGGDLPECPVCHERQENVNRLDLSKPIAPSVGGSNISRAVDMAYETAQAAGLTDMRTGLDPGENAAPKLTAEQQKMAGAWSNSGNWQAGQRFPGLAPGQGWMDAAAAASASERARGVEPVVAPVMRALKTRKTVAEVVAGDGRGTLRALR